MIINNKQLLVQIDKEDIDFLLECIQSHEEMIFDQFSGMKFDSMMRDCNRIKQILSKAVGYED